MAHSAKVEQLGDWSGPHTQETGAAHTHGGGTTYNLTIYKVFMVQYWLNTIVIFISNTYQIIYVCTKQHTNVPPPLQTPVLPKAFFSLKFF